MNTLDDRTDWIDTGDGGSQSFRLLQAALTAHMFYEHLQLFNRFGPDCLMDYYVGMLYGNHDRRRCLLFAKISLPADEETMSQDPAETQINLVEMTGPVTTIVSTDEATDDTTDAMIVVVIGRHPVATIEEETTGTGTVVTVTATAIETTTVAKMHATRTIHATKTVIVPIVLPTGKRLIIEESDHGHSADDEDGYDSESAASEAPIQSQQAYFTVMTSGSDPFLDGTFTCDRCARRFGSQALLDEHVEMRSCVNPQQLQDEETPAPKTEQCNKCQESFPSQNRLFAHIRKGCTGHVATTEPVYAAIPNLKVSPAASHTFASTPEVPVTEIPLRCVPILVAADRWSREWLNTLEHTIEKRTPTFISGVNHTAGKLYDDWAVFTFFVDGVHADGTDAGVSEFTCGAWIQDGGSVSCLAALLGNEWMIPLGINVLNTKSRLYVTALDDLDDLDDFYVPFEVVRSWRKVTRRVNAARATTVQRRRPPTIGMQRGPWNENEVLKNAAVGYEGDQGHAHTERDLARQTSTAWGRVPISSRLLHRAGRIPGTTAARREDGEKHHSTPDRGANASDYVHRRH
ncbi:hypothetical protein FDECE_2642 [Fusarium decemcellulare]|nr:hypothetical protein FDECE_2642 [Fusarium decemcellulare]